MVLRIGRRFWGPEPEGLAEQLRATEPSRLEALAEMMSDLPNWEAFREQIQPKP